jgi:hypothetical protein
MIYYILLVPCINKYESGLNPEVTHYNVYASTNVLTVEDLNVKCLQRMPHDVNSLLGNQPGFF